MENTATCRCQCQCSISQTEDDGDYDQQHLDYSETMTAEERLIQASVESVSPHCKTTRVVVGDIIKGFLTVFYLTLFTVAGVVAYHAISDLIESQKRPVASIDYKKTDVYQPPGIVIYSTDVDAVFISCGQYKYDIVDAPDINPDHKNCTYTEVNYPNPYLPERFRRALVFKGPTNVLQKEILFINFSLNQTSRNFSGIEYLLFQDWNKFWNDSNREGFIRRADIKYPTWTFSGGMLTWIRLSLMETYHINGSYESEFDVADSMVKYNDIRPLEERVNELFFVLYEWKDEFIQQNHLVTTISPWNTAGVLCGIFLTLFKAGEFATKSIRRLLIARRNYKKKKQKRKKTRRAEIN